MKTISFNKSLRVPVDRQGLWDWHQQPGAFDRLAPAWQKLVAEDGFQPMEDGQSMSFKIHMGPLRIKWTARIGPVEPPYRFVDTQVKGPFGHWRHEHRMEDISTDEARLDDNVEYALPFGLGSLPPFRGMAGKEVERLFRFRHERTLKDLERQGTSLPGKGKVILVSGSTGLIGKRLLPYMRTLGYTVRGLTRGEPGECLFKWDPVSGEVDPEALQDVDAVIHLAGENIASGRWTEERRRRILDSRVFGTRTLVEAMRQADSPPSTFICASGVNYYGSGGASKDENSPKGSGFLANVCGQWEEEAGKAESMGIRTVLMRTGVVLDPLGGALGKMLLPFQLGVGGPVASGEQAFPWIAMDDLLDVYETAIRDTTLSGPVNAVHPDSCSQKAFSNCLGSVLRRPAVMPLPESLVKMLFGQMGEETLLADLPIQSRVLSDKAFIFRFRNLHEALSFMLGKE